MALNLDRLSVVAATLSFLLILACTVPAARKTICRLARKQQSIQLSTESGTALFAPQDSLQAYEDEDGVATKASLQAFSDGWQKVAIMVLSVVGFHLALALAALFCLQSVAFYTEPSCVQRYRLANYAFVASLLAAAIACMQISTSSSGGYSPTREIKNLLVSIIAIAILRAMIGAMIPRRPSVYHDGQVVDQQQSASMLGRYTYEWVSDLLHYIRRNKGLEIDCLPKLPFAVRAHALHAQLESVSHSCTLWRALVVQHSGTLILQAALSLITSVLSFGPQIALYGILRTLESRQPGESVAMSSWLWVAGLGAALVLSLGIESWLWWVIYSRLWLPIYEGLSALVFAKLMRCKDVKEKPPSKQSSEDAGGEDDGEQENRQSVINLATVDSKRIADFVMFNYLIPSCATRLLIAAGFLVHLIGWPSLLCGLSVFALVMPVNVLLTKRYSDSQERFMKATDKRAAAVAEVLHGIRQIKFAAMEQQWEDCIRGSRQAELNLLRRTLLYNTGLVSVWILGPMMMSAVSLTVYCLTNQELSPSVAFTTLSVFGSIESALASLPDLFSRGMEAKVSADRIDAYMASAEKTPHAVDVDAVSFHCASIAWPSETEPEQQCESSDRFILPQLDLRFPPKGFSVIAGKTGTGKSLILASILGECDVLAGSVAVPHAPSLEERFDHRAIQDNWIIDSAVAYVAQNPWTESASIRDNILFGLPFSNSRYLEAVFASGLHKDLTLLLDGDMTDIGANGINLSGGQRWRISFARALYSRAGILILDDIFSALDAETGRHVYEHGLTGVLGRDRTRILVTHHISLCLPRADYFVVLDNGSVSHAGPVEELADPSLAQLLHGLETETPVSPIEAITTDHEWSGRKRLSVDPSPAMPPSHIPRKFTQDEKRETGSVSAKVYATYLRKGSGKGSGLTLWPLVLLGGIMFNALSVSRSWWVGVWTSSTGQSHIAQTSTNSEVLFYLSVYVGLSVAACVVGTLRYFVLVHASLQSSRRMFEGLLATVLRAPPRWLDTVPVGRILNRFTSDIHLLDWRLGYDLGLFLYKALEFTGILVASVLVSPTILVLAAILLVPCLSISRFYLTAAREIKRLESTAKSPVMEQFGSSLTGLTTIRAYAKTQVYIREMYARIDRHAQTAWHLWLLNRWLALRMSVIGAVFSTTTAALVVYTPTISAAMAGFAISFALQYNYAISMGLRFYADLEMDMNATERVLEYSSMETEDQGGHDPPAAWPTRGHIEVDNLVAGYAADLPAVLNGLSFTVEPNQRVGVVGRTGSGKSSLTLALYRFLEARHGRIRIDGLDVSRMKLQALRSRLAIIPQDPVLFSGTLRSNLDPFGEHTDEELWNALERVHMVSFEDNRTLGSQHSTKSLTSSPTLASSWSSASSINSSAKPSFSGIASLNTAVSEGGSNLSQGERQLLCLARAIVSQPKIMILDEATSAVDMETDALIQRSIRTEFGRRASSLLVIAHRLSTIADFDRILVMDAGKAVEFGPPRKLLAIEGGVFRNLVENSGERALVEAIILRG
ncbi:P-loop containing nucleoside triphosphate hydrolase protein [Aspergillus campestris IBT 28561]|uniref:P-loop containing nucleoside triphosphate hydrolase protein n=1 Tax=Aspergillus campestris (strain IBT 28561) TaxID=1392248 RepID=A0A2I1D7Y8_ASPC2|nr:P-loop containing nucleoside triphosphate hydrolase protein [Aspergillus campestris IBT 28561]PKY05985.1 P-loop containing nucleoside triphosphate hydrolase protein [Aspergillus campestris IBT 28561]